MDKFNSQNMNNNKNSDLDQMEESALSYQKLQEKSKQRQALQNKAKSNRGSQEEEDEEEDEEEYGEEDEGIVDEEQKGKLLGLLKNILKKVGMKSLFATGATVGGVGAIASLFVGMYRVHYNGEFEFKGISGEYQSLSFKKMNFTSFDNTGNVQLSGLTKENKLTKTYYTMYSDNSYFAVVEDSEKYSDINDAYKRKNLLTPSELREQYPDIKDVDEREKMFQLNPDVIYSLDRYLHKNQFLYPQQFIKPVYYEESQNDFALKQLADDKGQLTAKSQMFDTDGKPLTDSDGKLKKDKGVWDYGFASILRYKEYKVKEREVTSMSGSKLIYKGYTNQNNATDNSTENKEVSETEVGKITSSYIAPGIDSGGTSSEKDTGRYAYAIDTAVTAGGTIKSKVAQKWQEKEGSRKTITKTHQITETATKEVLIPGEQRTETQTIVYTYEIEYTYEVYTEEYLPYYEGDLDTNEITGSKYYRDYIKNYSNYIPVDVPNQLDFSVLDENEEIKSLIYDDEPGAFSSGDNQTNNSSATKEEFEKAVFMGDSITVGLSASSAIPENRVFATSGFTVSQGTDEFLNKIIQQKPPIVVISYGTNDAGYENPEKFKKDYKELITKLKSGIPGVKIYLNKIFPGNSSSVKNNTEKIIYKNIPSYNSALEKISSETGVTLIDCTNIPNLQSYYQDSYHFKSSFYKLWVSEMEKQIVSSSQSSSQQSGATFKAEFTAYKSGDGGYNVDASGNKLDYTKNTCAGPVKSLYSNSKLTLGSKIVIEGTGTEKDGMTCTVTDTGVPLDSDGTYHIDILVKDEATARKFGRRKGTIKILESNSSSSRSNTDNSNTTSSNLRTATSNQIGEKPLSEILEIGKQKETNHVQASLKYLEIAKKYGEMYGVDPYIICAMITSESKGEAYIEGRNGYSYPFTNGSPVKAGAYYGLMQIGGTYALKGTEFKAYNHLTGKIDSVVFDKNRVVDPDHNIQIGTILLASNFKSANYNVYLSILGHNLGINGAKFVQLYYLSNGTLSSIPSSNTPNAEQEAKFKEYSITNDTGWLTALYRGDLAEERAQGGHGFYDPNDGAHDASTWYASMRSGQPYFLRETMQYYAGDGSPWMKKEDGTVITADGGNASASGSGNGSGSANSAFNSYLASNWEKILELKGEMFPWMIELDEQLQKESKGNYSDLKDIKLAVRNKNKFVSNVTDTDVDLIINMMFALNQSNYLSKYDYMGEAEWKAMYNQLLSSPTGKTWDDKWIGFTCEEVFGKSLEDLGTLVKEGSGVNPTISRPFGTLMNSSTDDTEILPQNNSMNFGMDLSLPEDSEILSLSDGEILSVNKSSAPLSRYGIYVKIKYNNNTIVTISNLKKLEKGIKANATVKKGQILGVSGGDCKSYKEKDLHIELLYEGNYINPEWILTRDMNGFEDPIQGNNSGVVCNPSDSNTVNSVGVEYVDIALKQVGKPYVLGTAGPDTFDCSGLVYWSMKQAGIDIPRTSTEQRAVTQKISFEELQAGDLIFTHKTSTSSPEVRHVMIYIGNGQMLHSPQTGDVVKISPVRHGETETFGRYTGVNSSSGNNSVTSNSGCVVPGQQMSPDNGTFIWPVPTVRSVSSPFGMRKHPVLGVMKPHTGIDIPAPTGTDIVASRNGVVTFSGVNGGYGNLVIIDHGDGTSTRYAHNSVLLVKKNDKVTQGQVVAKAGATGMSKGAHLHFEVRVGEEAKNPLDYVKP